MAVAIHGFPRFTEDVDVLGLEADLPAAFSVLAPIGFVLSAGISPSRSGTPSEMRIPRVAKAVGEDLLSLDLILLPPFLADIWNERLNVEFADAVIQVVSREGLIRMKKAANRPIDRVDLLHLKGDGS